MPQVLINPKTGVIANIDAEGALDTIAQDPHTEAVDLYFTREDATPTLTAPIAVDALVLAVDSNTNVTDGDAITIMEGVNFFQSLVISSTANSITMTTPCDRAFTVAASVSVGPWNLAVDGSGTPQVFEACPPPGVDFDLYRITLSGLGAADADMDGTTFLSIEDGITNGFLLRQVNGQSKNLGLFVNNLGLEELGFTLKFVTANKHAQEGMIASKSFRDRNGVSVRLIGEDGDCIRAVVRDNLASESLLAVIIHGHLVTGQ